MLKWFSNTFGAASLFAAIFLHGLNISHSHPDIYHVRPKDGSRAIQPYSCHDPATKEEGVCMFSWNCQRANGTHITYCMDRFYFGSCCKLPPGVYIATPPPITSNEVTEMQKLKNRPSTRLPTTGYTSDSWSSENVEMKRFPSSTRGTPRPRPIKPTPTEFPPGLVTWRPESSTTHAPNKKKPTKLFSTKPLFASSTAENKTAERPQKYTTQGTSSDNSYTASTTPRFSTESARNPTTVKPNVPSSIHSTIKTRPTTPQQYTPSSVSSVSRRRTRPTRPYGQTNPKRRTRPTRPTSTRNSTTSQDIQRVTKPTESTIYSRPTTHSTTTERTTTYSTIGTWSNILERTTRPLPFTRRTPPTAPTRVTFKTTTSPRVSTTQRSASSQVSTTQRPASLTLTTQRAASPVTTQRPASTVTTTTRRPTSTVRNTTPRTTLDASTTRRRTRPTRPRPITTRRPSTTTRPSTTDSRTTAAPSSATTIEIVTFPPFPGVTRTTQRPISTTRVTDVRRSTTSRPKTTTVTVHLPTSTTVGSTTKSTTETPATTEKITPGNDYTQDITVAHTSDILTATQPEEISSTLNPDIELTSEQDQDTTTQWFTMTSGTTHNTIGRNPVTVNRPTVQVLYDENGHEILKQEEVQDKAASSSAHEGGSTTSMTKFDKLDTTVAELISSDVLTRVTLDLNGISSKYATKEQGISSTTEEKASSFMEDEGKETNKVFLKQKHNGTFLLTTPSMTKSTLEPRNPSSIAVLLENSNVLTSGSKNKITTKTPFIKFSTSTHTPTATHKSTFTTSDVKEFFSLPTQTTSLKTKFKPSLTDFEKGNPSSESIAEIKLKTSTDATILGDNLFEDYLYDNYDYYDDLFGENFPQVGESNTSNSTEQFLETVNNHKLTFTPLSTFTALTQKNTIPPNTINHSYLPFQTKNSQLPSTFSTHPDTVSIKNKLRPTLPSITPEGLTKPAQTLSLRPLKRPFLPNIMHEQIGKFPPQSIKRPLRPSTLQLSETTTTTQIPINDKQQIRTTVPSTDKDERPTIVTVDNHRPPTASLDESNRDSSISEFQDLTLETTKLSTIEAKPTSAFTTTLEDKPTHQESNEILDEAVTDHATKFTTVVNNHGVKYPFPTILMHHTTKDASVTESPSDTSSRNFSEIAQDDKPTTLTNNHGVKYPFTRPSIETMSTFEIGELGSISSHTTLSKTNNNSVTNEGFMQSTTKDDISSSTFEYVPPTIKTTYSSPSISSNPSITKGQTIPGTTNTAYNTPTFEGTKYPSDETNTINHNYTTTEEKISTTISLDDFPDSTTITNTPFPISTTTEIDLASADYKQVCGKPRPGPVGRVVGGGNSYFGEWPWVVSLRQWKKNAFLHKCGATLLNEFWVITAAHCVENVPLSDILLRLGEYDISHENEPLPFVERRVQIVASHPQFDRRTFEYDLALLRFYQPVTFQRNIIPACIPSGNDTYVGKYATVTGWGRLYEDGPLPDVIQEVSLPIITNKLCENMYRQAGFVEDIPEIFICSGYSSGGKDSCEGDSGGPMVLQEDDGRWVLAGVISWGIGCALPNQPGVYTRITKFSEWINQIIIF